MDFCRSHDTGLAEWTLAGSVNGHSPVGGGGDRQMGRNRWMMITVAAACTLVVAACSRSAAVTGQVSPVKGLVATTPAGVKPVSSVVWATNRDVISLDPDSLVRIPGVHGGLADVRVAAAPGAGRRGSGPAWPPSPTHPHHLVFTLRPGVKFWDGHPVTSADVVYSLGRQMNPGWAGATGQSSTG